MMCPHGNHSDEIDPATMCAQCEADAERRPQHLAEIERLANEAVGVIDLRTNQPTLPAELLPRERTTA